MPKCKYMKRVTTNNVSYCGCKSPKAKIYADYRGISRMVDLPIMGSSHYPDQNGNWWKKCVGGKSNSGVTPSKCKHYK